MNKNPKFKGCELRIQQRVNQNYKNLENTILSPQMNSSPIKITEVSLFPNGPQNTIRHGFPYINNIVLSSITPFPIPSTPWPVACQTPWTINHTHSHNELTKGRWSLHYDCMYSTNQQCTYHMYYRWSMSFYALSIIKSNVTSIWIFIMLDGSYLIVIYNTKGYDSRFTKGSYK